MGSEMCIRDSAGGIQGDEPVVIRKMRIGQLHGGGFAGPSMSQILPDILALQLPFLFRDYNEVDFVLGRFDGAFRPPFFCFKWALYREGLKGASVPVFKNTP